MTAEAASAVHDDLVRLAHRGLDVREYCLSAGRILGRSIPFDGLCVLTLDPATLLPVGEVVENGLPPAATQRMTEIELSDTDVNGFSALYRTVTRADTLSRATRGNLDLSQRHRELRRPHGFGDELRAVLADAGTPWGALTLLRTADQPDFTPADTAAVARASGALAHGLRQAILFASATMDAKHDEDTPGVVLLAVDNTVLSANTAAQRWLAMLPQQTTKREPPPPLGAVAARARRAADPSGSVQGAARARVHTPSGHWLLVRGSCLDDSSGTTAIIIEPAGPHDLAPLLAAAYGLTEREKTLTQLVARGHTTAQIADLLHLSSWTVQDHLKSVFDKVGVGSRGSLVAQLFFDHYAPRLATPSKKPELSE